MSDNLLTCLDLWAKERGSHPAFIFLSGKGEEVEKLSYLELRAKSQSVASELFKRKLTGSRAVLFFLPGLDFITTFLGCLYAGVTAVPIPPPKSKRQMARVHPVIVDAEPSVILTSGAVPASIGDEFALECIQIDSLDLNKTDSVELPTLATEDIAFLQYTSGSTSRPKGVMITHGELTYHEQIIADAFEHSKETTVVGWLPFYHDMGLIGNILNPLYLGATSILMAPLTFLQTPIRWLEAISLYRASTSGGPNFAYQLCLTKVSKEDLSRLDLSCWKVAFNGSEVVQPQTIRDFSERFAKCGFQKGAFYPCYGLAESTLFVTGSSPGVEPKIVSSSIEGEKIREIVSCGKPRGKDRVIIVAPSTSRVCKEGEYGEIWVSGQSVAAGYWQDDQTTQEVFRAMTQDGQGPFMKTGDLGFLKEGELYVLGRLKNLIILRGRNFFPNDIETSVSRAHPMIAHSSTVAFSSMNADGEGLVIVQEIERGLRSTEDRSTVVKKILYALSDEFQITPASIVLVKPNSLPRTTSGKIQYFLVAQKFRENSLGVLHEWHQPDEKGSQEVTSEGKSIEQALKDYIASLLGMKPEEISVEDPLVSYGVDSLMGVRFLAWVDEQFGKQLDVACLLEGSSIVQLVELLSQTAPTKKYAPLKSKNGGPYPLSLNQENIWITHHLNPQTTAYNIPVALRITGPFKCATFQEALNDVIERHDSLRAYFKHRKEGPYQLIASDVEISCHFHNLRSLPKSKRDQQVLQYMNTESNHVFDLETPPLLRATVIRTLEDQAILILNFHHLICDGWSMEVFSKDLSDAYLSRLEGAPPQWEPLRANYSDFVAWQRGLSSSDRWDEMKKYWARSLKAEEYPLLELTRLGVPGQNDQGDGVIKAELSEEICSRLQEMVKANGVTTAVALMAVFHALLHLYTKEKQVFVGYPSANRSQAAFQNLFGFFVNTLVCTTKWSQESSFLEILDQVKESVWRGAKYEAFPLQDVVKMLNPPRIEGASPLFQAMFVMQNASTASKYVSDIQVDVLDSPSLSAMYDLVLEVQEKGKALELIFEYKKEKYPFWFIQGLKSHFLEMLNRVISNPLSPFSQQALLSNEELNQLEMWQGPQVELLSDVTVVDLFETEAVKHLEKIAIYSDKGNMTYGELQKASTSIALSLIQKGLQPKEAVGFYLEREPLCIATILGILKAGGVYVPLDPSYPQSRICSIIEDARIQHVITSMQYHSMFLALNCQVIDPSNLEEGPVVKQSLPKQTHLAYTIYTSGSTGKPKGVRVSHRSLLNFSLAAINFFEMQSEDRPLQFSSLSWDTSSEEIYPCLLSGGSLVLRCDGRVETFQGLLDRTEKYGVTTWNLPSSYWHDLVDFLLRRDALLPLSLRLVIVGGEKVSLSKVKQWQKVFGFRVKLLNTYGATEATSISTVFDLSQWRDEWRDIPIGKPISNVKAYILDPNLQPVPVGVLGTLYLGGEGLAREYLNLPMLTKEKFVDHPLFKERLYCTGDTAYFAPTGDILIRGREDRQIKRRGFRIEIEEVEQAVAAHEYVEKCLVVNQEKLIAYIVSDKGLSSAILKKFLRHQLPEYMVPDAFRTLSDFPRLANGKNDYLSLYRLSQEMEAMDEVSAEECTDLEGEIIAIWKKLLGRDEIGKEMNFFDVGGDSLLLIKLHEALQEHFLVKIDISLLFSHFTCVSQGSVIEGIRNKKSTSSKSEVLKRLEAGTIDVSEARELLKTQGRE